VPGIVSATTVVPRRCLSGLPPRFRGRTWKRAAGIARDTRDAACDRERARYRYLTPDRIGHAINRHNELALGRSLYPIPSLSLSLSPSLSLSLSLSLSVFLVPALVTRTRSQPRYQWHFSQATLAVFRKCRRGKYRPVYDEGCFSVGWSVALDPRVSTKDLSSFVVEDEKKRKSRGTNERRKFD